MRAYRLETGSGIGAYSMDCAQAERMGIAHTHSNLHPPPGPDGLGRACGGGWVFGCPSPQALFAWFGGWLPLMLRTGELHVHVYDLAEGTYTVGKSGRQLAFDGDEARFVSTCC